MTDRRTQARTGEPLPRAGTGGGPGRGRPRFGIALGSGAARGWAHIGFLRVLEREGLVPDVVVGCSVGALVGGCYAAGKLDGIEDFALSLTRRRLLGMMDFRIRGSGLLGGMHLREMLERDLGDLDIRDLRPAYGAVATQLPNGHEVWLTQGSLAGAIRASSALPGIFEPVPIDGRTLMDGALVNPVPVTLARSLGADIVLCVNLNGDPRGTVVHAHGPAGRGEAEGQSADAAHWWSGWGRRRGGEPAPPARLGATAVLAGALTISQDRISRSRLAGDPPDIMALPRMAHVGLFEFHRAAESISLGRKAAERVMPDLAEILGGATTHGVPR